MLLVPRKGREANPLLFPGVGVPGYWIGVAVEEGWGKPMTLLFMLLLMLDLRAAMNSPWAMYVAFRSGRDGGSGGRERERIGKGGY